MSSESLIAARAARANKQQNIHNDNITAPGNISLKEPSKIRKNNNKITEEDKIYSFQLSRDFPGNWKPTDKATGKSLNSPYPPIYVIPNEGTAYDEDFIDEEGKLSPRARDFRYIEGQPSIWVDEQLSLISSDDKKINDLLGQEHNQLTFRDGKLNVRGIQKLKLSALLIQDAFEGKKIQYNPKLRTYKLNNPEAIASEQIDRMDKEFNAEKLARECELEKMLECAFVMGINIDDQSDSGLKKIRLEFIKKSKYDPKNPGSIDWFTGIVGNPVTHVTYVFSKGVEQGIISDSQQPGKLTWAKANVPIMNISQRGNIVDQLVGRYIDADEKVIKLLPEVEKQLNY